MKSVQISVYKPPPAFQTQTAPVGRISWSGGESPFQTQIWGRPLTPSGAHCPPRPPRLAWDSGCLLPRPQPPWGLLLWGQAVWIHHSQVWVSSLHHHTGGRKDLTSPVGALDFHPKPFCTLTPNLPAVLAELRCLPWATARCVCHLPFRVHVFVVLPPPFVPLLPEVKAVIPRPLSCLLC